MLIRSAAPPSQSISECGRAALPLPGWGRLYQILFFVVFLLMYLRLNRSIMRRGPARRGAQVSPPPPHSRCFLLKNSVSTRNPKSKQRLSARPPAWGWDGGLVPPAGTRASCRDLFSSPQVWHGSSWLARPRHAPRPRHSASPYSGVCLPFIVWVLCTLL